jgi:cytoskeletal protein RodZ
MTDQHISLAAQLRRARESRGVSLDQAHQVTGISLKVLGGLESDSTELVELIYMRLAMISYAEYLGLDVGEIAAVFDAETGYQPGSHTQPLVISSLSGNRPAKSSLSPGISGLLRGVSSPLLVGIGVAVLLVLVLIAAWLDLDSSPDDPSPDDTPRRAPISDSISARRGGTAVGGEDRQKQQKSRPTASDTADTVIDTLARIVETREVVGRWGPSSVAPPPGLILEAIAVDTTWVQVLWDGEAGTEITMVSGERRQWAARDSFLVRSGIAHGVQFSLQGQLLGGGRLGDPDEVLRFLASRDGVVLLGRNLKPVGEPITLTDPDSTDAQ